MQYLQRLMVMILFFSSLVCLRIQLAQDMEMSWHQMWVSGFWVGLIYDFSISLLVPMSALAGAAIHAQMARGMALMMSLLIWCATLVNLLYYRFFRSPLEWWTVQLHWKDIATLWKSSLQIRWDPCLILSLITLSLACVLLFYQQWPFDDRKLSYQQRWRYLISSLSVGILLLLVKQSPIWFHHRTGVDFSGGRIGASFALHPLYRWYIDGVSEAHSASGLQENESRDLRAVPSILAAYRNHKILSKNASSTQEKCPLCWTLPVPNAKMQAQLQKLFGLNQKKSEKPISVVILFVESLRAFEFLHPQIGRTLFPQLWSVVDRHGVLFTQAYSSSAQAGQTVRGKLSTLCSILPNSLGPSTYLAFPMIHLSCLASLFHQEGYQTAWLSTMPTNFHNEGLFESMHGTNLFFDLDYYQNKGLRRTVSQDLGLDDLPFLQESLSILTQLHAKGPLFAHLATLSTHYPHAMTAQGPVPESLLQKTKNDPEYRAYLSTLSYFDHAMGQFLNRFFSLPLAEDTLLVVLGDHSIALNPGIEFSRGFSPIQEIELRFRIPIIFISKNLKTPLQIHKPVHQIDVAPSVGAILSASNSSKFSPTVTWLGHSVWNHSGSDWVYREGDRVMYRHQNHACYPIAPGVGKSPMKCITIRAGQDPLFATVLPWIPEVTAETAFFHLLMQANRDAIVYDLFQKVPSSSIKPEISSSPDQITSIQEEGSR